MRELCSLVALDSENNIVGIVLAKIMNVEEKSWLVFIIFKQFFNQKLKK